MKNILIVDDEIDITEAYEILLQGSYRCRSVNTIADAKKMISKEDYDVVLTDINFPKECGVDLLKFLQKYPQIARIAISGYPQQFREQLRRDALVDCFLAKPVLDTKQLVTAIQEALDFALKRKNGDKFSQN